jgi:hypothetical protein
MNISNRSAVGCHFPPTPIQLYNAEYGCLVFLLLDAVNLVRRDTAPADPGTTALNANCFARLAILSPAMNLSSDCRSL